MSLAFHACPPRGQWMNDPNALLHAGGAWRLFVQHRDDAPAFRATGWARLSSADGLDWRFDGQVIRPDDDWAYSGSVRAAQGGLIATHTAHDAGSGLERQVVRTSGDAGLTWSEPAALIDAARDVRDPFACSDGALLLARPCGWSSSGEASQLGMWREGSDGWRERGGSALGIRPASCGKCLC